MTLPPSAASPANGGRTRALHDATIAALSVGSGVGVHFADASGPIVASAGVLAAAMVSRYTYGAEIAALRQEMRDVQERLESLAQQVHAPPAAEEPPVSWVAKVSHEIRSPLSAVVALGDMLDTSDLNPRQRALVQDIRDAGQIVLGLVNDTLDLAKAEAGRLSLHNEPFSLNGLCERVGRLGQALAADKPQLVMEVAPTLLDQVEGDELRLQQVLLNLVTNAVKFTNIGVVRLACERVDRGVGNAAMLRFTVSDSGPGLDAAEQNGIFKPYSRVKADALGSVGGTGLGLFLCRQIVEQMGGTIGVDSAIGQGSRFWFTVPLALCAQEPDGSTNDRNAQRRGEDAAGRLRNLVIAVVDDARLSREVARRIVEAEGGTCLAFDSAEDFLQHLRGQRVALDAVLMDLELNGMSGFEACRELRALNGLRRAPVIAVSGTDAQSVSGRLLDSGFDGHVLKPFRAETLVDALSPHFD